MKNPKIPDNEKDRLQELHQLKILDTSPEAIFDEITQLAACICGCEISCVSLVDTERLWFKSRYGLDVAQTSRDVSFCGHAILGDDILEVPDASIHPDFHDNPLCVGEPNIRFYAGVPLTTNNGFRIGTLCVIDRKPNKLDEAQYKSLGLLGKHVMRILEDKKNQVQLHNFQNLLEDSEVNLRVCSWQYNITKKELLCSKQFALIFETENLEDDIFALFSKRVHPDDFLQLNSLLERAIYQGNGFSFVHRLVLENSEKQKTIETIVSVQKNSIDEPFILLGSSRDITSEVLAQNNVKAKTQEIDRFFSMALDLLCVAGIDGRFKRINPSFCNVLGYTEEELLSREFIEFIHPDDVEKTEQEVEKLSKGIPTIRFENRYRRKDGSYCILSWTSSPNPETGLLYAAARDVTQERRQAQIKQFISEMRSKYINLKNNPQDLFDYILKKILEITDGGYGFVGEIKIDPETNLPFLKTFSLTNIAWNDEMRAFYDKHAPNGLEFKNLDTLFGYVIKTGEPLITNTPQKHHASAGIPKGHPPLDSFLGIPVYQGGKNIGMVGLANRPRGFSQEVLSEIQPFIDVLGEIIFAYQTEREINHQKEQIKIALEKAQAATQAKSDFLSTMSHEIRTPLNAIIVMSELLVESQLDADQRDLSHTLMNSGRLLLGIINDILDFSKIEAGKLDIDISEFNFNLFLHELVRPHQFTAEQKKINFVVTNNEIPFTICSDSQKIGQVINNLLSNAIKFTKKGEITITAHYQLHEDNRYWLRLSVQDTGIGIAKNKHDSVFTPFTQAEQSTNRNFGGTGLGLSISKQLIEFLGGNIRLESTLGKGTIFYVDIPFAKGTAIQPTLKKKEPKKFPPLKGKILVAEDNLTNQLVLGRILKSFALEYVCVQNGAEVLQKLEEDVFDLILMDCQMPNIDGYEATQLIRSESIQSQIPIIALTAHVAQGEEEKCIQAGMNAYVSKPIDRNILYERITRFLSLKAEPLIDQTRYSHFEELDEEEGFDIISETIQSFLTHSPKQISALQIGIQTQNWKQIADAVHSLHSTSRLLGAIALADTCYLVEHTIRTNSDVSNIPTEVEKIMNLYARSCAELREIYAQRNSTITSF